MEAEVYVRARKVFLDDGIKENTETCPECAKYGKSSKLRFFYLNLEEAIYKCANGQCFYPFEQFRFKNVKDNTVYFYEEVEDSSKSVFLKVNLDGTPDESHKILQAPLLLATANHTNDRKSVVTSDALKSDVEEYPVDFDTFFDEIINGSQSQSSTVADASEGEQSYVSVEQASLYTTAEAHSSQAIEPTPTMLPTDHDSTLVAAEHTIDATLDFYDCFDEQFMTASNACSESEPPNASNMDVLDDLLNILGDSGTATNNTKQVDQSSMNGLIDVEAFNKETPIYKNATAKVKMSGASASETDEVPSNIKTTTSRALPAKATASRALATKLTSKASATKEIAIRAPATKKPRAPSSKTSIVKLETSTPKAKLPKTQPVLTKCLKHIEKVTKKTSRSAAKPTTPNTTQIAQKTENALPSASTKQTDSLNSWMRGAEKLRPSDLARKIAESKMSGEDLSSIRSSMFKKTPYVNMTKMKFDPSSTMKYDATTSATLPTATITSKTVVTPSTIVKNEHGSSVATADGHSLDQLNTFHVEQSFTPHLPSLDPMQNVFSMPVIGDIQEISQVNDGGEGRKRSSDVFDTTSPEGESHAKRSRTCAVNDPPSTQNDTIPSNSINEDGKRSIAEAVHIIQIDHSYTDIELPNFILASPYSSALTSTAEPNESAAKKSKSNAKSNTPTKSKKPPSSRKKSDKKPSDVNAPSNVKLEKSTTKSTRKKKPDQNASVVTKPHENASVATKPHENASVVAKPHEYVSKPVETETNLSEKENADKNPPEMKNADNNSPKNKRNSKSAVKKEPKQPRKRASAAQRWYDSSSTDNPSEMENSHKKAPKNKRSRKTSQSKEQQPKSASKPSETATTSQKDDSSSSSANNTPSDEKGSKSENADKKASEKKNADKKASEKKIADKSPSNRKPSSKASKAKEPKPKRQYKRIYKPDDSSATDTSTLADAMEIESVCDRVTSPGSNENESSIDSLTSGEDVDGFTSTDIDNANLGICSREIEPNVNDSDVARAFIDISSPSSFSHDNSPMKRQKIDTSHCYQIRHFEKPEPHSFQKTDITNDWTDTESVDSLPLRRYSRNDRRFAQEHDDFDGISVSSTSSIETIRQRNGDFIVAMPTSNIPLNDDESTVSVSDAEFD